MAKKGFIKTIVAGATILAGVAMLTGCSDREGARIENLENNLQTVYKLNDEEQLHGDITKFKLIGTDVDKTAFEFDVNFNGYASFEDNSYGYASLNYTVPSDYFVGLSKGSSFDAVYDVFDKVVEELNPNDVTYSPVSNIKNVNDVFLKNEPCPMQGYHIANGLLYNLGEPTFNEENKTVSFDTETLVRLKKGNVDLGLGIGVGFTGGFGIGIGITSSSNVGDYTIKDNYTIKVDAKTFEAMKQDSKLVYDYCVEAIKNKDESKVYAERISARTVNYNNGELLSRLNVNEVSEELSNQ